MLKMSFYGELKDVNTISLCMIVKDEEDHIARCLDSVKDYVDEIIIVDTGSKDNTKEIVRNYTDKVYDFEWIDDFASARNFSFSKATSDYIMWLDADDVVKNPEELQQLRLIFDPNYIAVSMPYHLWWDEFGNVTSSLRRNRIVKRSKNFRWIGKVHEYLEVCGPIFNSEIIIEHRALHHDNDRNIKIYEKRLAEGEIFSPRDIYYYANELRDHLRFAEAVEYYEKFLDSKKGWIEDNIACCLKLHECYLKINDQDKALSSLLHSFVYDRPRPDLCCKIGDFFLHRSQYEVAVYWYDVAIRSGESEEIWSFSNKAYSTWFPHLQMCVAYDKLGQWELAYEHNEKALFYRPGDEIMVSNKKYFDNKLKKRE